MTDVLTVLGLAVGVVFLLLMVYIAFNSNDRP